MEIGTKVEYILAEGGRSHPGEVTNVRGNIVTVKFDPPIVIGETEYTYQSLSVGDLKVVEKPKASPGPVNTAAAAPPATPRKETRPCKWCGQEIEITYTGAMGPMRSLRDHRWKCPKAPPYKRSPRKPPAAEEEPAKSEPEKKRRAPGPEKNNMASVVNGLEAFVKEARALGCGLTITITVSPEEQP